MKKSKQTKKIEVPEKKGLAKFFNGVKKIWKLELAVLLFILVTSVSVLAFIKINTISGTVIGIDNKPVKNAEVSIAGSTVKTDVFGRFRFGGVTQNPVDIEINTKNYETYSDQIFRGRNFLREFSIELDPLDYSYIKGKLILDGQDYTEPEIFESITIDEELIQVEFDEDNYFISQNLETKDSQMVIDSNLFETIEQNYELIPGENFIGEIELTRNEKKSVTVTDWATKKPIEGVNTNKGDTDENGQISLTNLEQITDEEVFDFKKDGYLSKALKKSELTNSVELVPSGSIAYSSNKEGVNSLYSSNIDGTNETRVTEKKVLSSIVDKDKIYFTTFVEGEKRGEEIYSVNLDGSGETKINSIVYAEFTDRNQKYQKVDLNSKKIITVEDNYNVDTRETLSRITTSDLDGSNSVVIRNRLFKDLNYETVVLDSVLISSDNTKIAYTIGLYENVGGFYFRSSKLNGYKMYDVDIESGEFDEVYKDENEFKSSFGNPVFYSGKDNILVFTQRDPQGQITRFRAWDGNQKQINDITGLPNGAQFNESNNREVSIALSTIDNQSDLYVFDSENYSTRKITENGNISSFEVFEDVIYFTTKDTNELFVIRDGEIDKLNVSSNGGSWGYTIERFGGYF